ncbi:unnamed protein product [Durusdinium trenchii]|uniref:Uncharacterized protein n=1 Tax=Durusdinium trenchii TaxID=1381693 RepID=A0ABP0JZX2_9DINO
MGWSQGKGKQASWQAWNVWPPAKKKEKKEGKGKPSESKGPELPAYEALGSTTSSSSGAAPGKGVDQLKQEVLDFLHSKDIAPEGQLKELLQLGPLEDLKSEQRTLNTKKKLLAKLDKLKNKAREKKASWEVFLQKIQEHHLQQETAYKSDLKTLEGAIAETQDELNKIVAKEQEGMDTSSGVEKMGEAELRRQLADSQAQIHFLQQKMEAYATGGGPSMGEFPFNATSPQVAKKPSGTISLVAGGFDSSLEARQMRSKMIENAKRKIEDTEIPSRTPSRERSPRRDNSNSLERMG